MSLFNFLFFFIASCKQVVTIEKIVEKEYAWKKNSYYDNWQSIQLNSFSNKEGLLYTLGLGAFNFGIIELDSLYDYNSKVEFYFSLGFEQPLDAKFPINDFFYVLYKNKESEIGFFATSNPTLEGSKAFIKMGLVDSTFQNFLFPSNGEGIVVNSLNQALVPYYTIDNEGSLLLVSLEIEIYGGEFIKVKEYKKIVIPNDVAAQEITYLKSYNELFLISTAIDTYSLLPTGSLEKVLETPIYRSFEYKDDIYGFGYKDIFVSSNGGKNWTNIGSHNGSDLTNVEYAIIDNRVLAYRSSNIYEVIIDSEKIDFIVLENEGLEGNLITSISEFQNQVYVTTLSGVYFRPKALIFEPKKEE